MTQIRKSPIKTMLAAFALAIMFIAGGLTTATPAFAIDLQTARAKGLVGETQSGYVAAVRSPSGEVAKLIAKVNSARRARYRQLAQRNNLRVEEVASVTAPRIISALPAGSYFQAGSGGWRRK